MDPLAKPKKLVDSWKSLESRKQPLVNRTEEYAMWTLPYVFPPTGIKEVELNGPADSTGSRAVNHLSNKLVMTLFPAHSPFFRLMVATESLDELNVAAEQGDAGAKEALDLIDKELARAEKDAMRALDYNKFRTEATMAAKSLIITGNALMYAPEGGRTQVYSLRDYCVERDVSGNVVCLMTRDKKAFGTFSQKIQDEINKNRPGKKAEAKTEITIYTRIELNNDGKYDMTQAADDVKLSSSATWTADELPYIVLTWNLVRGEDYGRGLVEDYAGAFHALHTLNNSLIDMVGIAADIKWLVNPQSQLDVKALNDSESGTYHTGSEGDLTTPQLNKAFDMQFVEAAVNRFQQQIGQAFLLNSSVTRDAERVTAEEIRYVAQELELSHGGIYSRFAEEWQLRLAVLKLAGQNIKVGGQQPIYPQIITGLDSLSRAGDLDNLRMFVSDLQLLNEVPEELRAVIDPIRFAQFIAIRRGVDSDKFTKSAAQFKAEQEAAMAQQQNMIDQQAGAEIAVEAGKQSMQ